MQPEGHCTDLLNVCVWFRHVKGVGRSGDSPTQNQSRPKEHSDQCPAVSR